MGKQLQGHGNCLICHPSLDPKNPYLKRNNRLRVSDRRRLQESIGDLLAEYEPANDVEAEEDEKNAA